MKPSARQKQRVTKSKPAAIAIDIVVEAPEWRTEWRTGMPSLRTGLRRAARLALKEGGADSGGSVTLLLADDATLKQLNAQFRGKNKPTNVLSFPAASNAEGHLGDIAIAHGVSAREANEAGKSLADHATHLAVHGALHLLGYDHETAADAKVMEPLEVAILSELGIADPYRARTMEVA